MCGWGIVFIMSIWLNDMVSQRYGVTKRPKLIKKCVNVLKYICHRRQTD